MHDMLCGKRKPKLRWYQFRLSTLLAITAMAAGALVGWRALIQPYRQQRVAVRTIERVGGSYQATGTWQRKLFGDDFVRVTLVNLAECDRPHEFVGHLGNLPFLETLVVGRSTFTDDDLRALYVPALRALVLDSTSISEAALIDWKTRHGDVEIYQSDRRALAALETSQGFRGGFT